MRWNILGEPTNMSKDCQVSAADPATQAVLTYLVDDRGVVDKVIPADSQYDEIDEKAIGSKLKSRCTNM